MLIRLNAPKKITYWIAVALAAVGFIASFLPIPILSTLSFWLVIAGFVLLALGNTVIRTVAKGIGCRLDPEKALLGIQPHPIPL